MISVSNVTMRYGSKLLFEDVSVTFHGDRRYGLTGPNGSGKSTFMKVLTGELDAQKGTVVRPKKFGVLKQNQYEFDAFRVIDTVIMGNKGLWSALEEREVIYSKPEMTDEDGIRLGELEGIVGEEDGYEADSNAAILLQGLDIPDELHNRKMSELQGGQKVRVLLAQALFGNPDALFLDEPTNYLDLDSIHWLENFLTRYSGTVITISHDRHFLNSVCTHIADIDYETIITYTGGYDEMVMQKTQIRSRIESQNEQREKKIAQLNEFIARFSAGTRCAPTHGSCSSATRDSWRRSRPARCSATSSPVRTAQVAPPAAARVVPSARTAPSARVARVAPAACAGLRESSCWCAAGATATRSRASPRRSGPATATRKSACCVNRPRGHLDRRGSRRSRCSGRLTAASSRPGAPRSRPPATTAPPRRWRRSPGFGCCARTAAVRWACRRGPPGSRRGWSPKSPASPRGSAGTSVDRCW